MVAWCEHRAVYWVHNTLLDSVGNGELLAIAEQTQPVTAVGTGAARRHVTVLNAGSIQGAAHKLAAQLRADGVKVAGTGNLAGSSPAGTEVQYAPGKRAQATLLAHLLASRSPTRSSPPPRPQTGRRRRWSC